MHQDDHLSEVNSQEIHRELGDLIARIIDTISRLGLSEALKKELFFFEAQLERPEISKFDSRRVESLSLLLKAVVDDYIRKFNVINMIQEKYIWHFRQRATKKLDSESLLRFFVVTS